MADVMTTLGSTSHYVFPTVEVLHGRIKPHGYYRLIHRDSWVADPSFYYTTLAFTVFFILLRLAICRFVVRPLGKAMKFPKENNYTKLEEAVMQVGFYTWAWAYNTSYLVKQYWFWHPIGVFYDGFPRQPLEPEMEFFFALQIGWYLHGVYTHFFLDTRKSDFNIMIVHHTVTLSLQYGCFVAGYFRAGMLVMFSMDVCDIFLYAAQILKIVKSGGVVDYPKIVYYVGFGMIPVTWFFFRLVYMPFVLMRTTAIEGPITCGFENADGSVPFNILLFILLCLNTWWFSIIARIMWRSLTSQNLQALDDIREREKAEARRASFKAKGE